MKKQTVYHITFGVAMIDKAQLSNNKSCRYDEKTYSMRH